MAIEDMVVSKQQLDEEGKVEIETKSNKRHNWTLNGKTSENFKWQKVG